MNFKLWKHIPILGQQTLVIYISYMHQDFINSTILFFEYFSITIKHIAMNNDMMSKILLCLPVQSLMRFRAVCKTWGNLIDSQRFQKLHTRNNDNNKSDDTVYLQLTHSNEQEKMCMQVTFPNLVNRVQKELSIKLQWDRKSLRMGHGHYMARLNLIYSNLNNVNKKIL